MTTGLLLYVDGQVREVDVDVERTDVTHQLIGADALATINLRDLAIQLLVDDVGLLKDLPLNLAATMLTFGTGRRPSYPVVGTVLVLGLAPDGDAWDVPDDLLDLFTWAGDAS